jgi:hypothetical protein
LASSHRHPPHSWSTIRLLIIGRLISYIGPMPLIPSI